MYYGFTIENNKYDSYNFRLLKTINKRNITEKVLEEIIFCHYIFWNKLMKNYYYKDKPINLALVSEEFKLKKSKINIGTNFKNMQFIFFLFI